MKNVNLKKPRSGIADEIAVMAADNYPLYESLITPSANGRLFGAGSRGIANTSSSLYRAISILCGISGMPFAVSGYKFEDERNNYLLSLLNSSVNNFENSQKTVERWIIDLCCEGDSFSIIHRDRSQKVIGLEYIDNLFFRVINEDGTLLYEFSNTPRKGGRRFLASDVLHFTMPNFYRQQSWQADQGDVTSFFKGSPPLLAVGDAAKMVENIIAFNQTFFENGLNASLHIGFEDQVSAEMVKELKEYFKNQNTGLKKGFQPLITRFGAKVKELNLTPQSSQMIETLQYSVDEIGRAYGIPSYMLNQEAKNTSFGSGLSTVNENFVKNTLSNYINRLEAEINFKLLGSGERIKIDTSNYTAGTKNERVDMVSKMAGSGGYVTIDEARMQVGLPPIEFITGDKQLGNKLLTNANEGNTDDTTEPTTRSLPNNR